ncbi:hypothetical protein [Streptomyces sp. NPDC048659]|uniref:RICIN domain-containing protein n=1 Tax=Streptomyces sp. NPDC048659 TaxID=3155489 RepID=UPI00341BC7A7
MRTRAKVTSVLTAAGTALLLGIGTAPAAHAAGITVVQYQNSKTGLCLDSNAKGQVYAKVFGADNPYQQWERAEQSGKVVLRNVQTRRCLDLTALPADNSLETNLGCGMLWKEINSGGTFRLTFDYFGEASEAVDSDTKGSVYTNPYGPDNPYQQWHMLRRK